MMPYQTYRLYDIQRPKSAAEIRSADERAGRIAAAIAELLLPLARASRMSRSPRLARRTTRSRRRAVAAG
ncbi:MAG TPA: hypothetical protein VLM11_02775 [Streptosporangiaceae bacterium]|nr:hypothetical protein [Streptosporangiaceae bacterium]